MLTSEIPDQLSVKAPPFTSVYRKRAMRSQNLFCWFNTEDDPDLPHISVEISLTHNVWRDFHITFPILHQGGWDTEPSRMSFSIHYRINGGSIEKVRVTDTAHIKRVDQGGANYATMTRDSGLLALRFVQCAMVQSALA